VVNDRLWTRGLLCGLVCSLVAVSSCQRVEMGRIYQMPIYDVDLASVPDGTHEGSFTGLGFTYVVRTTVQEHQIVQIDVVKNRDNNHSAMAEAVIPRVLAKQTPKVDAVTGATVTSKALLKAVENSLTVRSKG
jgi:uncharacterized protein with FMN-binding domain